MPGKKMKRKKPLDGIIEKDFVIQMLDMFVENMEDVIGDQLIKVKGQTVISNAMGDEDRRNYYIGASDQLEKVIKVIGVLHKDTKECIKNA